MNAIDRLALAVARPFSPRRSADMSFGDYLGMWGIDGPLFGGPFGTNPALQGDEELPSRDFIGMAGIYGRSSVVFAAFQTRWKIFSQMRYQYQQLFGGRPGALFGTPDLAILEHPEPGETTIDLNFRAIQYADLAGDWFGVRRPASSVALRETAGMPFAKVDRIKALRPDWTVVVLGSRRNSDSMELAVDPDAEILGFGYLPGGPGRGSDAIAYGRDEIAHFHPNTGSLSRYRGMPLMLAAMPEVIADNGATQYKRAYFRNAATPNVAITFPQGWDEEKAKSWARSFESKHEGALNGYKALYLNAGIDYKVVGSSFTDMDFNSMQGHVETRIAAITGMHPVIIPFSEALGGSALNAGNYQSAQRSTADITLHFLWPNMCGSLETIVPTRPGTRLWYDERSVPFLRADLKDRATVRQQDAMTIGQLVDRGFTAQSAIDAVVSDDMTRLVHSGLVSVQLQAPGNTVPQQAAVDFWPSGPFAEFGHVARGMQLPSDHALVRGYPSLFGAVDEVPIIVTRPGPARLVSAAQVEAARQKLLADGRPAGQVSIAAELNVSRDTVRRALAPELAPEPATSRI